MPMALAAVAPARPEQVVAREPTRPTAAAATGNRAFGRILARCGAGGCTCGGKCGGAHADDELLLEEGQKALARAVQARSG